MHTTTVCAQGPVEHFLQQRSTEKCLAEPLGRTKNYRPMEVRVNGLAGQLCCMRGQSDWRAGDVKRALEAISFDSWHTIPRNRTGSSRLAVTQAAYLQVKIGVCSSDRGGDAESRGKRRDCMLIYDDDVRVFVRFIEMSKGAHSL